MGGHEGIDKRVGSWGKKKKAKEKGMGPAPADLHPPLNKKRWARNYLFLLADKDAASVCEFATEEREQKIQGWEAESINFGSAAGASACY